MQLLVLIFLAFVWGSSFILMKRGLESFDPYQVAALRIGITFLVLMPFAIARLKKLSRKQFWYLAVAGIIGNGIPAFLYTIAQTNVSSSIAGVLNSLTPLFTLLAAVTMFKTRVSWINVAGILAGLGGAILLVLKDGYLKAGPADLFGLLIVVATLFYGFNTNHVKHNLADVDGMGIASVAFFIIGPFAVVYLFLSRFWVNLEQPGAWSDFGAIAILAIAGTAFALILWNILIKKLTAIFAASVTYVIPVFALMWGIIDGESINLRQIFGMMMILAGIYLVNKKVKSYDA